MQMPGKTFHELFLPNIQSNAQTRSSRCCSRSFDVSLKRHRCLILILSMPRKAMTFQEKGAGFVSGSVCTLSVSCGVSRRPHPEEVQFRGCATLPAALDFCVWGVYRTIAAQPLDRGVLLTLCQAETTHSVAPLPGASCLISSGTSCRAYNCGQNDERDNANS